MRFIPILMFITTMMCGLVAEARGIDSNWSLAVKARFNGPRRVDADHPIVLLLFDDGSFQNVVASRTLAQNGAKAIFTGLPVAPVYLLALYDEFGSVTGLTIPTNTPIGILVDQDSGQPTAIEPSSDTVIEMTFNSDQRYPGNPDKPEEPLEALETADNGIVEIRTYTTKPGKREEFIRFFEERTLSPQAEVGIRIPGQFRSLDDENKFVWTRSFRNQAERVRQTRDFYLGDIWLQELGPRAAEFIESTEVVILEPTAHSILQVETAASSEE